MKKAGIREARQNLSALIDEVKKGREIIITERGKPVARLVPPERLSAKPFHSHAAFRARMPVLDPPLSETILRDREESPYWAGLFPRSPRPDTFTSTPARW
jgi:prevent-host-death family protein